jgi:hypothetical protein
MNRMSAPFLLNWDSTVDPGDLLDVLHEEIEHVLEGMGLDAQVVAGLVAVGHRCGDPVDVQAQQVEQFAAHDGDLGRVDAVGAEHRAAAALGALEEVVPPLLEHIQGHRAGPGQLAQDLAGLGEIVAVDRAQQFGPQHRHVLGVAGADEKVALVGAGAAAHADVHEDLEGAEFFQPLLESFVDDLLPVFGQLPVLLQGVPLAGVGRPGFPCFWGWRRSSTSLCGY